MKLSKTTTIAVTSASAVIYGFGVFVTSASAQESDIVSPEVTAQIQSVLGNPDSDELLVDALTQVESQLREYNSSTFSPREGDSVDITELKLMRRQYIQQLRERMQELDGPERGAFLQKIRDRRQEVRKEVFEIRKERFQTRKNQREEAREATKAELEARREQFKENLQNRLDAAKERALPPQDKLKSRVEATNLRRQREATYSDVQRGALDRIESREREKVKGAIDYQPTNIFERVGYWLFGN